ncbi:Forkhead transcription factor HCM1 [Camponotus floridanus]|uniref:Forkhead transcription factor HCM1 n=1 Tax=Camponotus floridanus TaxID=104421 RepID=E2B1J7_CAMFO|nr:defective pharyngeal development protein 4 [Camponotus floridanus]XP_025265218.1 defective pharyngeal development protein 4 [Camponotus floridanus]XP_025265219.1 defective pharyngeal development protein 4 [Camponotus floridanus]EFN60454.1 Forkhead transcription factor HCM1 [Camponotus floridanus]
MIGPSSGTGEVTESRASSKRKVFDDLDIDSPKRKIFDELDIDSFCEEIRQTNRKRYLQELETPEELVATSNEIITDAATLFSPISAQEIVEESQVAHLEVLLVDGTNCTWTTMSELEQQQNLDVLVTSSSSLSLSSSSSSSTTSDRHPPETYAVEETNYQPAMSMNYWQPGVVPAASPANSNFQQNKGTMNNNQQQQQFEDQENGNLSWLLDFKLDSFIEAADDRSTVGPTLIKDNHCGNKNKPNGRSHSSNYANDIRRGHENSSMYRQDLNQTTYPANGFDNRNFSRSNGPKKPPFTYTELIEHALQERGELTVSAIYQWISEHFPYYKSNDDRWKNSVRHNLSINPHFRKGSKAPHGAGHLWAIANRSDCRPRPLAINGSATTTPMQQVAQNECDESRSNKIISEIMDEVEAATASIAQPNPEDDTDNILNPVTLEDSAEQILNGIKREVEVQYLVPMMVANSDHEANQQNQQIVQQTEFQCPFKESDFLNPVSKEVVAEECGLVSEGYLVTDLNPNAFGLNVIDPEIIGSENLFGEELSFQFYELTSPSQLQSA